jgi:hypothetical protein
MLAAAGVGTLGLHAQEGAPGAALPDATVDGSQSVDAGQSVDVGQQARTPNAAPATAEDAAALAQSYDAPDPAEANGNAEPEAQSRPWKVNLHGTVGTRYDSNVFISSSNEKADLISTVSAGGGITLGDYTAKQNNYVIADYAGTEELFARGTAQNAYNQQALLDTKAIFGHLTVSGTFQFSDTADGSIDIGTRARSQITTGEVSARLSLSDKSFVQADAQVTAAHYDLYLGSDDSRAGLSFHYIADPNLTLGVGGMGGVLNVQDGSQQTYEQALGSAQLAVDSLYTLKVAGGVERRQMSGANSPNSLVTPVLELAGDYKMLQRLDLSLTAYRRVLNSAYYSSYDYISTGVSAGCRYELNPQVTLMIEGGYQNLAYRDAGSGNLLSRTDDYFFMRPALAYAPSHYWSIEVFYLYRADGSSNAASTFTDTQAGANLNVTF